MVRKYTLHDLNSFKFQFSSVTQLCPTLCDPMDCHTTGFHVHHQLLSIQLVLPSIMIDANFKVCYG